MQYFYTNHPLKVYMAVSVGLYPTDIVERYWLKIPTEIVFRDSPSVALTSHHKEGFVRTILIQGPDLKMSPLTSSFNIINRYFSLTRVQDVNLDQGLFTHACPVGRGMSGR